MDTQRATETIAGGRVRLAPLDEDNIYRHFQWSNDPDLNRLQSELPYEEEMFGDFKRRFEQIVEMQPPHERHFEIRATDGTIIGVAFVGRINRYNRNCELSVTIGDTDERGKGYGRESLELLLRYCFEELEMHRVTTQTFAFNDAWRKLVESVGFRHEGTEREHVFRDGEFWDKHTFGMLESEYTPAATSV